jgi:polyisoprenoid-binding protein YceI
VRTALLTIALTSSMSLVPVTGRVTREGPPTGTWNVDPARSVVQFTVTKLGYQDVTGQFLDFSGAVRYDAANPSNSSVQWRVRISSVRTDARGRDESLQAREYSDSARHPEMAFRSERVTALDEGRLQVHGVITIKGQSRPLQLVVSPIDGGFETRFELDRYDFGIAGGRVMGRLIGRTVRVRLVAMAAKEGS